MVRGSDLLEVHGGTAPGRRRSSARWTASRCRTLYQDPCYGVRQLVDIAIRAVSPAINDPTTAVQALDRLHGILRAIADRPDPSGVSLDAAGSARLVVPVPDWNRVFDLAFTEIALYGAGDPQISRKLMAIFDDLSSCVTPDRLAADRLAAPVAPQRGSGPPQPERRPGAHGGPARARLAAGWSLSRSRR